MKTKKRLKPFTFTVDEDNRIMLEHIKKKYSITWNMVINMALRDYIDRHFNKDKIVVPLDDDVINSFVLLCDKKSVDHIINLQQYIGNCILEDDIIMLNQKELPVDFIIQAINENADI